MSELETKLVIDAEDGASEVLQNVDDSLKNVNESVNKSDSSLKDLDKNLKKLGTSFDEIETGINKFEKNIITSFDNVSNNSKASGKVIESAFEKALDSLKSPEGIKELEKSLERLQTEGRITEKQFESLQNKIKETAKDSNDFSGDLKNIGDAASELGGPFEHISSLLGNFSSKGAGIAGVVTLLTAFAAEVFKVGEAYRENDLKLTTFLGSQEKTNEVMEYARKIANLLGQDVLETANTWAEVDKAAQANNISVDRSRSLFESLSHAIIATGGNMDDVRDDAVELFNEALTEGTVNGEALQELLRGRLAPAFEEMAKSLKLPREEFGKLLDSGIDVKVLIPLLDQALRNAFGDTKAIDTTDTALKRLHNNLDAFYNKLYKFANEQIGLFDGLRSGINQVAQTLDTKNVDAWIKAWGDWYDVSVDMVTGNISLAEAGKRNIEIQNQLNGTINDLSKEYQNLDKAANESADNIVSAADKAKEAEELRRLQLEALEKEYEKLGISSSTSLQKTVDEMRESFEKIKKAGTETTDVLDSAFLALAEEIVKSSYAMGKPIDESLKLEAASRGLSSALEKIISNYQELSPELDGFIFKAQNIQQVYKDSIETFEQDTESTKRNIQAVIDLARAKGDNITVQSKTLELSKLELSSTELRIALNKQLINALDVQANAIFAAANADGVYDEKEKQVVSTLIDQINLLKQKNELAQNQLPIIQKHVENNKLQVVSNQNLKDSQHEVNQSLKDGETNAEGWTKAGNAMVKHTNDAKPALQGLANYLQQTRDLMDSLSEKTRLLFEVEMTRYINMRGLDGAYKAHQAALAAYNETLTESEKREAKFNLELRNAQLLIEQTKEKSISAATGFQIWETAIERAAGIAKKSFYEQAIAMENLTQRVESFSEKSFRNLDSAYNQLNSFAYQAKHSFNQLDESQLSNLKAEIQAATNKIKDFQNETLNAKQRLSELDAEILEAKGLNKQADLLRNQIDLNQQLADIEQQKQQAQLEGNLSVIQYLNEQETKLKELSRLKIDNINAEAEAQKEANKKASEDATNSSLETANRTKSAWDNVTNAIKEAKGSLQEFSNFDLSRTNNQFNDMLNILEQARTGMR